MTEFIWPTRVYYEDTDAGGVVYHSNYLNYMERARTEWLRSRGFELDQLQQQQNIMFVVRAMQLDFRRPARFNQLLQVSLQLVKTGKASMVLEQQITIAPDQNQDSGQILVTAEVKIACVDTNSFKPTSIPNVVLKEIVSV